mmetsp:Transcript_17508/g.25750  ORF Transcript_17508/g.25750 Transcript_17508/m.25750 type:complete len:89 (+) Transcript_17508:1072-1338(+)
MRRLLVPHYIVKFAILLFKVKNQVREQSTSVTDASIIFVQLLSMFTSNFFGYQQRTDQRIRSKYLPFCGMLVYDECKIVSVVHEGILG